ncbi:MAG: MiaB/RimO family radical SAM methylthiotransferase [Planctomycetia bacterium]|nr:MiaB/RimO family radical SAM methylthiotransferase [Planctomycetia bacterium]
MWFKTATLGCKVNQYETQWLRAALMANGWHDADANGAEINADLVDWVFINTCSVTQESDAKSRKLVSHYAAQCPNAKIALLGCYAASHPQQAQSLSGVTCVLADKRRLPEFLSKLGLTTIPTVATGHAERHRAYLKVQDGCRVGCAYCVIPQTRPYLSSRPIPEVLAEARALAQAHYHEIVLTGIHLGHYGLDFGPNQTVTPIPPCNAPLTLEEYYARHAALAPSQRVGLAELLQALAHAELPQMRVRLGSLEAIEVNDAMLEVMARHRDFFCPHFHLSMQSGDDTVLRGMRRRQLSGPFIERCREILARFPNAALTTDVIVGFPGETEEQFQRTCEVVETLCFSRVHVFRFSPRPGTIAAEMPRQVDAPVKKERAARLQTLARRLREEFARKLLGGTALVVVEEVEQVAQDQWLARGCSEHYYSVETLMSRRDDLLPGQFVRVELTDLTSDVFRAKILERNPSVR